MANNQEAASAYFAKNPNATWYRGIRNTGSNPTNFQTPYTSLAGGSPTLGQGIKNYTNIRQPGRDTINISSTPQYSNRQLSSNDPRRNMSTDQLRSSASNTLRDPNRVYVDNSVSGTYQSALNEIDPRQINKDARNQYEPGLDRRIDTYEGFRPIYEDIRDTGIQSANDLRAIQQQQYADQTTQLGAARDLGLSQEQALYNELVGQADISRQSIQRTLEKQQRDEQARLEEQRGYLERQLPELTDAAKRQAATTGLYGTTQTTRALGKVGEEVGRQQGELERSSQSQQQYIADNMSIADQQYYYSIENYKRDQMNNAAALHNEYMTGLNAIQNDDRMSEFEKATRIRELQDQYRLDEQNIQKNITDAEVETENLIQQAIQTEKDAQRNMAVNKANYRGQDITNEATYLGTYNGQQTMAAKTQALTDEYQQLANESATLQNQLDMIYAGDERAVGLDANRIQNRLSQIQERQNQLNYNLDVKYGDEDRRLQQEEYKANIAATLAEEEGDSSVFFGRNTSSYTPQELADYGLELIGEGASPLTVYQRAVSVSKDDPTQDSLKLELEKVLSDNGLSWDAKASSLADAGARGDMQDKINQYWNADDLLTKYFEGTDFITEDVFGPVSGRVTGTLNRYINEDDRIEGVQAITAIMALGAEERNRLFGATLTDNELKAFKDILGDPTQPASKLAGQLQELRRKALETSNRLIGEKSDYVPKKYDSQLESQIQNKYADMGSDDISDLIGNGKKITNESAKWLLKNIPAPQGLKEIASAIMQHEGFDPDAYGGKGTLAYRNNNPGNLRFIGQAGGTQGEGGFAKFNNLEDGFKALMNDIESKATGNTRTGLGPNSTLYDLFKVYAPSEDNNNPKVYAETVAANLGVSPSARIGSLIS